MSVSLPRVVSLSMVSAAVLAGCVFGSVRTFERADQVRQGTNGGWEYAMPGHAIVASGTDSLGMKTIHWASADEVERPWEIQVFQTDRGNTTTNSYMGNNANYPLALAEDHVLGDFWALHGDGQLIKYGVRDHDRGASPSPLPPYESYVVRLDAMQAPDAVSCGNCIDQRQLEVCDVASGPKGELFVSTLHELRVPGAVYQLPVVHVRDGAGNWSYASIETDMSWRYRVNHCHDIAADELSGDLVYRNVYNRQLVRLNPSLTEVVERIPWARQVTDLAVVGDRVFAATHDRVEIVDPQGRSEDQFTVSATTDIAVQLGGSPGGIRLWHLGSDASGRYFVSEAAVTE
jgi:hypothetical protein